MRRKEIKQQQTEKITILTEEDARIRLEKLQELAKKVGASTTRMVSTTNQSGIVVGTMLSNKITETEIVQNIEQALQTASMFDMCRTAARNFWFTMLAALAAFLSALAAWWLIVKMVR